MKKLNDKDLKKVEGGSTKITVISQTRRSSGNGQHTIKTYQNHSGIGNRYAKQYKIPNMKQSSKRR